MTPTLLRETVDHEQRANAIAQELLPGWASLLHHRDLWTRLRPVEVGLLTGCPTDSRALELVGAKELAA